MATLTSKIADALARRLPIEDRAECKPIGLECPICGPLDAHVLSSGALGPEYTEQTARLIVRCHFEAEHPGQPNPLPQAPQGWFY